MRHNTHLVIVSSQRRIAFTAFLLAGALVLASSLAVGAETRVTEIRTQTIGKTVYFEAILQAPDDLVMPKRESANPPAEIVRRTLAAQPRLVPCDRNVAAVYFLSPPTDPINLIFLGKVGGDGPARLRLLYPTGTTSAAAKGSLLEPYLHAPTWGEAMVTLDFSKARRLDPPGNKRSPKRQAALVDLQSLWAQAQENELAAAETQAPGFGFYRFARQATARKYHVLTSRSPEPSTSLLDEGHKHLYELTTGGATLAEALAQQRMRSGKATRLPRARDIHSLPSISLPAHPWERMIGARVPAPEPLARWVPEDNYYATAHGVRAYLDLAHLLDQWGGNVLHAFELTSRDEQVRSRYEKQLCLPAEQLAKKVDLTLIRDLAITGSDLYWREGSDVSVLFHVTDSKRFLDAVDPFLQNAGKEFGALVSASRSKHRGATIESYVTPLREISLHRTTVEDVVFYSNSLTALHRILDTRDDPAHSLWRAPDFRYMRTIFRRDDKDEDGFAFLSDAFIRRLLSPGSKIKEQRRLQALASLTLAHHAALFHAWETGRLPANQKELLSQSALDGTSLRDPEGKEATWNAERQIAVSKLYGTHNFLTPLVELSIDRVTADEEKDYQDFVREYQRLWQSYLDPAGLRLTTRGRHIRVETHILPVVRTQGYDFLRQLSGGRTTTFDLSRLSPRTLVQFLSTFGDGSVGLGGEQLGEAWAMLALEDSPIYRTLIELGVKHEFQPDQNNEIVRAGFEQLLQLPLTFGLRLPGDKDGTATARQGQELLQFISNEAEEKVKPYRGTEVTRRRIPNARRNLPGIDSDKDLVLYHARIDDAWFVSLSEDALHRLIDQSILRRRDKKAAPRQIDVATSLFLAPQALQQSAGAVFGYLEWESHRRALANGLVWYALYRGGLLAADADEATQRSAALHHLGFVPVSPDGFSYRYDAGRDDVRSVRHGSYRQPRLGDGLDERSVGRQVLGSLHTLRVDLRFREDGVQTALIFERKKNAAGKPEALLPVYPPIFKLGGWIERRESLGESPLLYLNLSGTMTKDVDLVELKKIPGLHTLNLDATAVTDAGLKHLRDLPDLREVYLDTPGVSDVGATTLHDMKSLRIHRPTDMDRFVEECWGLGGKCEGDDLNLAGTKITDAWLARLKVVPHVKRLNLRSTPLTDEGLVHLAALQDLQVLYLTNTHLSNAGLKHLYRLKSLEHIDLDGTNITDNGVEKLLRAMPGLKTIIRFSDREVLLLNRLKRSVARLNGRVELLASDTGPQRVKVTFARVSITDDQLSDLDGLEVVNELDLSSINEIGGGIPELGKAVKLQTLNLSNTTVTSRGLRALRKSTQLRELFLANTFVLNTGLAHLKELSKLERLDLSHTDIGDDGMAHLKELTRLRELRLDFTRITDASLPYLRGLTRLEQLHVRGTFLTPAGIDGLQKALPRTRIIRN